MVIAAHFIKTLSTAAGVHLPFAVYFSSESIKNPGGLSQIKCKSCIAVFGIIFNICTGRALNVLESHVTAMIDFFLHQVSSSPFRIHQMYSNN